MGGYRRWSYTLVAVTVYICGSLALGQYVGTEWARVQDFIFKPYLLNEVQGVLIKSVSLWLVLVGVSGYIFSCRNPKV